MEYPSMWYLGIDQHKRYLTICVRDEQGQVVLRRQVRTRWEDVDRFLRWLQEQTAACGGYLAVLEVCGFNQWLIQRLEQGGCRRVYVIAAPERARQKTDRRDAAKLSELLWINRDRIAAGQQLVHVKEVYQPTEAERADRQLTHLRYRLGRSRTRVKNRIKGILRRHNLEQDCPTKGGFTQAALRWLARVELPPLDRLELDILLANYHAFGQQWGEVEAQIRQRAKGNETVRELQNYRKKMGAYTALALAAHIGPIKRFPTAGSLPNYFGLTPGCRNSGESDRPGGMTKAGHPFIRFLLGQMVLHVLREDPGMRRWYRRVKRRRGAKVARVGVMRRTCESIWHILSQKEDYRPVDDRKPVRQPGRCPARS